MKHGDVRFIFSKNIDDSWTGSASLINLSTGRAVATVKRSGLRALDDLKDALHLAIVSEGILDYNPNNALSATDRLVYLLLEYREQLYALTLIAHSRSEHDIALALKTSLAYERRFSIFMSKELSLLSEAAMCELLSLSEAHLLELMVYKKSPVDSDERIIDIIQAKLTSYQYIIKPSIATQKAYRDLTSCCASFGVTVNDEGVFIV